MRKCPKPVQPGHRSKSNRASRIRTSPPSILAGKHNDYDLPQRHSAYATLPQYAWLYQSSIRCRPFESEHPFAISLTRPNCKSGSWKLPGTRVSFPSDSGLTELLGPTRRPWRCVYLPEDCCPVGNGLSPHAPVMRVTKALVSHLGTHLPPRPPL